MKAVLLKDLSGKSIKELRDMRSDMVNQLHNLRMKHMTQSLQQPHLLRIAKKNIARITMFLHRQYNHVNDS